MLSESDLRELLEFTAPHPVLSVYLNTVPTEGNADAYKLRLRTMLKEVQLPNDISVIEHYINHEYDWSGRSVAIFSCAAKGFWRVYPLAIAVPNQIYLGDRPAVKPLAGALDAFGGYGVVLVDKQGARLFHFHLGELREQDGVVGETVKHTKHGGASAVPGRRGGTAGQTHYEDELVERNMKENVDFTVRFFEENHVRRILIGGSEDNVAQFRSLLPKAWQSLIVGTFPMSMTASHLEVLAKAMQVGLEAEQRRQARLIDGVVTAAAKGSGGALGLKDTLAAIADGRVQTLVLSESFRESGYRCKSCGYLMVAEDSTLACPLCGGSFETIPDVVELAVAAVMKSGAEVEVMHDNQALVKAGKMGAVLRY